MLTLDKTKGNKEMHKRLTLPTLLTLLILLVAMLMMSITSYAKSGEYKGSKILRSSIHDLQDN